MLIAALADGAGSAGRAEVGAQLACSFMLVEVTGACEGGTAGLSRQMVSRLAAHGSRHERAPAPRPRTGAAGLRLHLLVAVVGAMRAVFVQIGDGAMVVDGEGEAWRGRLCLDLWPDNGEYENTTYFADRPQAADHLGSPRSSGRSARSPCSRMACSAWPSTIRPAPRTRPSSAPCSPIASTRRGEAARVVSRELEAYLSRPTDQQPHGRRQVAALAALPPAVNHADAVARSYGSQGRPLRPCGMLSLGQRGGWRQRHRL